MLRRVIDMLVNENGCPFCNEFNGRRELSYFELTFGARHQISQRSILETAHFVCVPSIGSFVEGYVLVIPRRHFLSALTMPRNYVDELLSIVRTLSEFYRSCYQQNFLIYEHGTVDEHNLGGMSVAHAHLHLVPCRRRVISMLPEFHFLPFHDLFAARSYYLSHGKQPYLLLKDADGCFYLAISEHIPSQYFRKKVCDICGVAGTGDWKEYPYIDNVKKTLAAARRFEIKMAPIGCEKLYGTPALKQV